MRALVKKSDVSETCSVLDKFYHRCSRLYPSKASVSCSRSYNVTSSVLCDIMKSCNESSNVISKDVRMEFVMTCCQCVKTAEYIRPNAKPLTINVQVTAYLEVCGVTNDDPILDNVSSFVTRLHNDVSTSLFDDDNDTSKRQYTTMTEGEQAKSQMTLRSVKPVNPGAETDIEDVFTVKLGDIRFVYGVSALSRGDPVVEKLFKFKNDSSVSLFCCPFKCPTCSRSVGYRVSGFSCNSDRLDSDVMSKLWRAIVMDEDAMVYKLNVK